MKVILVNGPNLNLLGEREVERYGSQTLANLVGRLEKLAKGFGMGLLSFQSNSEGDLIGFVHEHRGAMGIINAGAYAHTSIALRDALAAAKVRFVEVHITNPHARESFRQKSYLSDLAEGVVVGLGTYGYELALRYWAMKAST